MGRRHCRDGRRSRNSARRQLRDAARAALPPGEPHYKLGSLNRDRFKIELPSGEGTVHADSAIFDLDEPDFTVISLIYDLAKAGDMAMIESGGPSSTILFDRAQLKSMPPEFRRPKPALCTSAGQLARMLGVSTEKPPARPKLGKTHQWSRDHDNRYLGRLPGLREDNPSERHICVEIKPGEGLEFIAKSLAQFTRALKKQKQPVPEGGGLTSMCVHKEPRLPTGEIFIPLDVTGYGWRPNTDHLIPANIERWLAIARAFGRETGRNTGMIVNGKMFVLDTGRRYPLAKLESRTAPD